MTFDTEIEAIAVAKAMLLLTDDILYSSVFKTFYFVDNGEIYEDDVSEPLCVWEG